MRNDDQTYIRQRLIALATVHLTRRKDLEVTRSNLGLVDLVVGLVREGEVLRKEFGVILRGTIEPLDTEDQASKRLNSMRVEQKGGRLNMPVCVFLFSMQGDEGYYDWQARPSVEGGRVTLECGRRFSAKRLDVHSIDEIVKSVEGWYEALYRLIRVTEARSGRASHKLP
jgi:hypothetical protein